MSSIFANLSLPAIDDDVYAGLVNAAEQHYLFHFGDVREVVPVPRDPRQRLFMLGVPKPINMMEEYARELRRELRFRTEYSIIRLIEQPLVVQICKMMQITPVIRATFELSQGGSIKRSALYGIYNSSKFFPRSDGFNLVHIRISETVETYFESLLRPLGYARSETLILGVHIRKNYVYWLKHVGYGAVQFTAEDDLNFIRVARETLRRKYPDKKSKSRLLPAAFARVNVCVCVCVTNLKK